MTRNRTDNVKVLVRISLWLGSGQVGLDILRNIHANITPLKVQI